MRVMLVANVDVPHGFANGATGRLGHWGPESANFGQRPKPVRANVPGVQARFYVEASMQSKKAHFLPEVDFLDIGPRKETVTTARGKPSMLQLPLQPAYALTIHKVQALTIYHVVHGCLEGVFAHGQIYVLSSRVTDPRNFHAVGLPPKDLLEEVARAWRDAGLDVEACFEKAASVTGEWEYVPCRAGSDPCTNISKRLRVQYEEKRRVPLKLRTLKEILDPQPETASVLHGLLEWIDLADRRAQRGQAPPPALLPEGDPLFPDPEWWLTEFERRRPAESHDHNEDYPDDEDDQETASGA
jgi:hypothetical protein